ncbi:hypothetical protein ABZ565_03605 [Streptomyces sp. NPDC016469]|uniref:hypothetical protein n=1 Tax=Streptomyces sp. NPDC016469 TaxID=3157191 RepID=UPI0033F0BD62
MAPKKSDRIEFLRALRQLHRARYVYTVGTLLWAASVAWTGRQAPGSRQMWVSALLLTVFAGLLITAAVSLRRLAARSPYQPAHHAASHKTSHPRRAHA